MTGGDDGTNGITIGLLGAELREAIDARYSTYGFTPSAENAYEAFGIGDMPDTADQWDKWRSSGLLTTRDVAEDICGNAFTPAVAEAVIDLVVRALGRHFWEPRAAAGFHALAVRWDTFRHLVQHWRRYLFLSGAESDASAPSGHILTFLRELRGLTDATLGLVQTLDEGTALYRGRLTLYPTTIRPTAKELGPAPARFASANRMSPAGIAMFYAGGDPDTAIAEIAGHGVESHALVGTFVCTRPLLILDLTAFPMAPSPFDREHRSLGYLSDFASLFVREITAPIPADQRQHLEYVPTQIVTEFLRFGTAVPLDGIRLPSAQTGRPTYVLFFDASNVADFMPFPRPELRAGTEVSEASQRAEAPESVEVALWLIDAHLYEIRRSYESSIVRSLFEK